MTAQYDIRATAEMWPEDKEPVWYWFEPFSKWYPGSFVVDDEDGGAHFVNGAGLGFCDYHDVPFWMPLNTFRPMNDPVEMV